MTCRREAGAGPAGIIFRATWAHARGRDLHAREDGRARGWKGEQARLDVRFAEITCVGQQRFDLAQFLWHSADLVQHRLKLLLVIRGLNNINRDGATYTAAKLTHLASIILYLVPAMNAVPALAGLLLKGAGWSYPLFHLAVALALGDALAMVPPLPRLK